MPNQKQDTPVFDVNKAEMRKDTNRALPFHTTYDAAGKLVAEYATTIAAAPSEAKVSYLTADHLGSPRINTDANSAVISRQDYQPFGEEITRANYGTDSVKQKFTSYEKDNESGLDYAQARYYSNQHGRFTSSDPIILTAERLLEPQRINLYAYTKNNPLNYTDPLGEDIKMKGSKSNQQRHAKALSNDKTKLKLKAKDGKLKFDGKDPARDSLTPAGQKIYDAIKSDVTTNISVTENDGSVDFESPASLDSSGNVVLTTHTFDYADIDVANAANIADFNESSLVLHGTLEAIGIQMDGLSPVAAHNAANGYAGAQGYDLTGKPIVTLGGSISNVSISFTENGQVTGGGSNLSVEKGYRNSYSNKNIPTPPANPNKVQDVLKFRAANPIDVKRVATR